ncbi:hypothetical protein ACIRSS_08160 [Amycolatopsis sp. NPDC101161]|uniref:hypothetical protein n=1 Tax=Amycolatopsis sp. NPDC101161 TaxID=3363940 RepID=UPI0037FFEE86
MDSSLFSHPIAEELRPGTLTTPQDVRYGGLFRQPVYTPSPSSDGAPGPQRRSGKAAHDPSGRR